MSEPVVQRALQRISFGKALAVVFFAGLAAMLCAGSLMAFTPDVWDALANRTDAAAEDVRKGITGAGLGLMLGIVPGVLVDKTTPMLTNFLFAAEAFAGYFPLFWAAHGALQGLAWPVIGVLFFLVGQSTVGAVLQTIAVLTFNAPQARRGFVIGAVVASLSIGSLVWSFLEAFVFEGDGRREYYVLCLALAVPTCYFVAAFLLFKIDKQQEEPEARPSLPPLFAPYSVPPARGPSQLADGTSIDDELAFKSDADYTDLLPEGRGSRLLVQETSSRVSIGLTFAALALVIPGSLMWNGMQSQFVMHCKVCSLEVPYLYPGGFILSALLTGFFSDFFYSFQKPYWIAISGVVGTLGYLLTAFQPVKMWYGQQMLQGAVLACALVAGIAHLSFECGPSRIGVVVGLAGLPAAAVFVCLMLFLYYNPEGVLSSPPCEGIDCLFYAFIFFALVCFAGAVLAVASAIVAQRKARVVARVHSAIYA